MKAYPPIFVVGTGRSGSTVFFDIFSKHPNVAWLSWLADEYPDHDWPNSFLMKARSSRLLDACLGKHFGPSEAYRFWDRVCPGFTNPYRDLVAADVTPSAAHQVLESLSRMTTSTRNHMLVKITGWPRVRFLKEIFPDALFIEVTRSPFATATSLLAVSFWDGWRGPPNWRRGSLPPDLETIWKQEGESFAVLAAIEYVIVQRAMAECRASLPAEQMHTVSYTQLCADPIGVFQQTIAFCGLNWSSRFETEIKRFNLIDRDEQWSARLTVAQQEAIRRTLEKAHFVDST